MSEDSTIFSKRDATYFRVLTMLGHFAVDLCQGALPSIFPFLILNFGFSYTSSAGLLFASSLISSITQPIFGHIGDKVDRPWFMSFGVFFSGLGIAAIGILGHFNMLNHYWLIFILSAVVGFGVALFHPEGAKISNFVSGDKKAQGIGIFTVGGNIGFAISPVVVIAAIEAFGMIGLICILIPCLIVAALLLARNSSLKTVALTNKQNTIEQESGDGNGHSNGTDDWSSFTKMQVVLFLRSIIGFGLRTFIPMFFIVVLAQSIAVGNTALSVFSVATAVATLAGGVIADKLGYKRIIIICSIVSVPALAAFAVSPNVLFAMAAAVLIAFALSSSYSTTIALSQSYLPSRIGLASGISLGMAISVGGLLAPGLGWIGDTFGLINALIVTVFLAVIVLVFSFLIPNTEKPAIKEN